MREYTYVSKFEPLNKISSCGEYKDMYGKKN